MLGINASLYNRWRQSGGGVVVPDNRLMYAPPDYSEFTVQDVPAGPSAHTQYNLTAGTDYVINLPSALRQGNVTLSGGRSIVIIGGEIEVNAAPDTDQRRRCLYLLNNTGDVFVEGVHFHINGSNNPFDCVYIHHASSRATTLTFQNCLFDGIIGTSGGFHGDGIQFQDSAQFNGTIRFHRCTFRTAYQAYYNTCDGEDSTAIFNETNFVCTGSDGAPFWSGDNGNDAWSRKTTVFGEGVYLDPDGTFDSEVRPNSDCVVADERPVVNSGVMTWPNSDFITGELREGVPPGGDWVTSAIAGHAYVSPGYL